MAISIRRWRGTATRCLAAMLRGEIAPRLTLRKVPVVLPSIFTATGLAPLSAIVEDSVRVPERCPGVLDCSVLCGFAYADTPHIGFTVAVVSDGTGPGEALAEALAGRIWQQRRALLHENLVLPLGRGVDEALATKDLPVVILEHADRLNDSTWVLRELVTRGARDVVVPYLWDPGAAQAAIAAGEGAEITLPIGGHSSPAAGGPVELSARVLFAGRKVFTGTGPMRRGRTIDLGPCALLDAGGIVISVISNATTAIDLDALTQFGLDPADFAIILLRSKTHFRAVYEPIAARIVIVETADWGRCDLGSLPYRHVPPGVFPIDPAARGTP